MGLFDFFKDEFIEVIDWVEQDPDVVLWKFPDRDANIKYGAQLTVRESQVALFVDEGQIADVLGPGQWELITENLPVLTTLRNWDKGFKSPFKVDVYFISTRTFTNLKWGTPNPVIMTDPQFKQVRVRAHGVYFVKVKDPATFFKEFAGTHPVLRIQDIEERLRGIVAPKFSEVLAESGISVMGLVANYTELGDKIRPFLQKDVEPFGLEITKFQITSTTLPKEVEAFYDKVTNMNMVEDMERFTRFLQAQAIEKAADNPGGGAGEGIGIGVGLGMAKMMMDSQERPKPASDTTAQSKQEILDLLKQLGGMVKEGILTQEEFEAKKKELLSRL